jgi:4-hydroxybenzoate polyprenyltransferase
VWTNVLAGMAVSNAALEWVPAVEIAVAVSLMYTAGMFLNDAFDRDFDARVGRHRPIPAGEVSAREVFAVGWALLVAGLAVLALGFGPGAAVLWGLALASAIVYYDYRHKRDSFGPVVMALCRGLVYCVAAAAVARVNGAVLAAAAVLILYVLVLTWIAKRTGPELGWLIALLIAGISLVDATLIAVAGHPAAAAVAATGFAATLAGQRWISGV